MSNSSVQPIDRTLSDATTLGQSGPRNNVSKGVLHIPQSSSTGGSPSDCLVSYTGHLLVVVTSLQRCSPCILQPQPTGLYLVEFSAKLTNRKQILKPLHKFRKYKSELKCIYATPLL